MSRRARILGAVTLLAVVAASVLFWWLRPRRTPAERGYEIARRLGCEACHGPGGTGGVKNPGSLEKEVPAFTGGTAMMYVESEQDLREWILDGRPRRLETSPAGPDALIEMPAYRGRLEADELDDLMAWYSAVAGWDPEPPPPDAAEGRRVAARAGCFGCHGAGGRIGAGNPGALKGYIPGWGSEDFYELVRDEAELRAWVEDGISERLVSHPIATRFRKAQLIAMPAYRDVLEPAEIDAVVAYIRWVAPKLDD